VFAGSLIGLFAAASAWAFQPLPLGGQVNDDVAAGIVKTQSISGEDPANADVVGGALAAGAVNVPWAIFEQETSGHNQVFVRSFAGGGWTTRGAGTVGGFSSAGPTFPGSLNFNQGSDGEVPAIEFAGTGRTVPWATWYEATVGAGFANNNIFASRFDNTGDANQGKWIFAGQNRGSGPGVDTPSLNIHTNEDAENPSVAGGSAVSPTAPGPWIAWQETTSLPVNGKNQIFVVRPIGPDSTDCDTVTPAGVAVAGHVPAIGGFCWQDAGTARVGPSAADPSLNVDPTRDGIEPDIAFTGPSDSVPWVVWYETGTTAISGLHTNDLVFAAKAVADPSAVGGFQWVAVGSQLQGTLDTTGPNSFGTCAASETNESQCSLNNAPASDAEDPRVAAGTMSAGTATVPWVTWDETVAGVHQVFVARLVGTGATAAFQIANNGAPISAGTSDSTRPDIAFSGNTPYVTWREDVGGGVAHAFVGHFINAADPTFVLDESDVALTPTVQADVREPVSSSCTANPFNGDGAACQGGSVGTPFFLFTNGTSPLGLFANAYEPATPVTAVATAVSGSGGTLNGGVDPDGATVGVFFQYGTSTAYGQTTAVQVSGIADSAVAFTSTLSGLAAGTTIHYRVVAVSDFGTFPGDDQTFTTTAPSPPPPTPAPGPGSISLGHAKVSGGRVGVSASCHGETGATCALSFKLTVRETTRGHKLIAVTARKKARTTHKVVTVGSASVTLTAGQSKTVQIGLNAKGAKLLHQRGHLKAELATIQALAGSLTSIATTVVTFKRAR
jgi:hypothetical protein